MRGGGTRAARRSSSSSGVRCHIQRVRGGVAAPYSPELQPPCREEQPFVLINDLYAGIVIALQGMLGPHSISAQNKDAVGKRACFGGAGARRAFLRTLGRNNGVRKRRLVRPW